MDTAAFFDNLAYGEDRPILKLLLETPWVREIRITFRQGQELKAHKAPFPIVVQVLEGDIDFGVEDVRHHLQKGMMISLAENIIHDLKAGADSVVRLSLHKAATKTSN